MESEQVADHYNKVQNQGRDGRVHSPNIHLRNFNNWVKSVLIQRHTRPGYAVLDIACGKGGDMNKWERAKVVNYVGCDVADKSICEAIQRYNTLKNPSFAAKFLCGDCFEVKLSEYTSGMKFDIASCQFAIHYAFGTQKRVRTLLRNVTEALKPGGFFIGTTTDANVLVRKLRSAEGLQFGNSIFNVAFDNAWASKKFPHDDKWGIRLRFSLGEQVDDCPEYLVHWPSFEQLAAEYGLEPLLCKNLHDFYQEFAGPETEEYKLMERMKVFDENGTVPDEEWDAAYVYLAFAFKKLGAPNRGVPASEVRPRSDLQKLGEDEFVMMQAPRKQNSAAIRNIID